MLAEFYNLNLSDQLPQHIFTSEILLHSLDLLGRQHQLLHRDQTADNPVHHEKVLRVFLEDERKISPNLLVKLSRAQKTFL